jgi:hypothetical protein
MRILLLAGTSEIGLAIHPAPEPGPDGPYPLFGITSTAAHGPQDRAALPGKPGDRCGEAVGVRRPGLRTRPRGATGRSQSRLV